MWNLFGVVADDLKNRTNCALERYNRHFNNIFPNKHPNITQFASAVYEEAERWVDILGDTDLASILKENIKCSSVTPLEDSYRKFDPEEQSSPVKRRYRRETAAAQKKLHARRIVCGE